MTLRCCFGAPSSQQQRHLGSTSFGCFAQILVLHLSIVYILGFFCPVLPGSSGFTALSLGPQAQASAFWRLPVIALSLNTVGFEPCSPFTYGSFLFLFYNTWSVPSPMYTSFRVEPRKVDDTFATESYVCQMARTTDIVVVFPKRSPLSPYFVCVQLDPASPHAGMIDCHSNTTSVPMCTCVHPKNTRHLHG